VLDCVVLIVGLCFFFFSSKSPLNGQAAELWDKDPKEYKRLLMLRHREAED
jgi:ubiquitin-protein ligase